MEEIFEHLDTKRTGLVQLSEMHIVKSAFESALSEVNLDSPDSDTSEDEGEDIQDLFDTEEEMGPKDWTRLNMSCLTKYGEAAWRRAMEKVVAVCRITRHSSPLEEEEEPWTISVNTGGEIISSWFSEVELKLEEKEACRALATSGDWRCLSCEAEALDKGSPNLSQAIAPQKTTSWRFKGVLPPLKLEPDRRRANSHCIPPGQVSFGFELEDADQKPFWSSRLSSDGSPKFSAPLAPLSRFPLSPVTPASSSTAPVSPSPPSPPPPPLASDGTSLHVAGARDSVTSNESAHGAHTTNGKGNATARSSNNGLTARSGTSYADSPSPPKLRKGKSWRSMLWRCQSLGEMLSHRSMRPIRKLPRVGDEVLIVDVTKGTARPGFLGCKARIVKIWIPSDAVVKREWCQVRSREDDPSSEIMVPLTSVVALKVPLRPGDMVEAFPPIPRVSGQHAAHTSRATVLGAAADRPHLVEVSFEGVHRSANIPLSWVRRVELSPWTQVLRKAPFSTLVFLLSDLHLQPSSPIDAKEVQERLRRDFEPHGRCRYIGSSRALHRLVEDTSSGENSPSLAKLAKGDTGKINSLDLEAFAAEVVPDRKRHLRLRIPLEQVEPHANAAETLATSGPTTMRAFDEDPPILAALKRGDADALRSNLAALPRGFNLVNTLLKETDCDGNTAFHAAIYMQSLELWKILWAALIMDHSSSRRDEEEALSTLNDWGRSPLWIALEAGNSQLCSTLLDAGASVFQEAVMLATGDKDEARKEFYGGPGFVNAGCKYTVHLFTPAGPFGLRLCQLKDSKNDEPQSRFVVARCFGEAASASIMPGDVLVAIGSKEAAEFVSLPPLIRQLTHSHRPLELEFLKGSGLFLKPLHRACDLGFPKIVELLIGFQADLEWRDLAGNSALDRAVRRKNRTADDRKDDYAKCISVLVEAGATEEGQVKVLLPTKDGITSHIFVPPPHWKPCESRSVEGRFWMKVEEETDPNLLQYFRSVVDRSSWGSASKKVSTKDRRGKVPAKLMVDRVQRIENVSDVCEYLQRKQQLRLERADGLLAKVDPPPSVKFSYSAVAESEAALEEDLNEAFLFHGTTPNAVEGIVRDGFLLAFSGSNAGTAFGKGVYFAEDCLKCDEYTKEAPFGHPFAGLRPLLLSRVLLGKVVVSEERDVSSEIRSIMHRKCDSLIADRKAAVGTFREFVVFDADQVCTDYVLWYRRSF